MQKDNSDRFNPQRLQSSGCCPAARLVQCAFDRAIHLHALRHLHNVAWRDRPFRLDPAEQVFLARDFMPRDLQNILEAGGGDHAGAGAFALQHRIGGDGRAVQHGRHARGTGLRKTQNLLDAFEKTH